jgi:hypothetical protein
MISKKDPSKSTKKTGINKKLVLFGGPFLMYGNCTKNEWPGGGHIDGFLRLQTKAGHLWESGVMVGAVKG